MGLICGLIFWIKYNLCAFIIGTVVFYLLYAIVTKQINKLLLSALYFLSGFILTTVPVLIYFALNSSLSDLFTAYFYNSIFVYSGVTGTKVSLIRRTFYGFGLVYRYNFGLLAVLIISVLSFSFLNKKTPFIF